MKKLNDLYANFLPWDYAYLLENCPDYVRTLLNDFDSNKIRWHVEVQETFTYHGFKEIESGKWHLYRREVSAYDLEIIERTLIKGKVTGLERVFSLLGLVATSQNVNGKPIGLRIVKDKAGNEF